MWPVSLPPSGIHGANVAPLCGESAGPPTAVPYGRRRRQLVSAHQAHPADVPLAGGDPVSPNRERRPPGLPDRE